MPTNERHLLIVWHSRTGASRAMAEAAARGAGDYAIILQAQDAGPQDFLESAGYLFVCPENLAGLSGLMKEMFDRCYYPLLGKIEGRAYSTLIAAGSDGEGAQRQIDRIAKGWRLRRVSEPLIINFNAQTPEAILAPKAVTEADLQSCQDVGAAMAEGLSLGLF